MSEVKPFKSTEDKIHELTDMREQLDRMETLFKRRFDEISMEINATSQQVDMAEENTKKQFTEVVQTLAAISYSGDGNSQVNAGVELEAVIEDTENAATTILDAADRISAIIKNTKIKWNDEERRDAALEKIHHDIQNILLACTFQDMTGQRIRNTLDSLEKIETQLSGTLGSLGIDVTPDQKDVKNVVDGESERFSQDDIDNMF